VQQILQAFSVKRVGEGQNYWVSRLKKLNPNKTRSNPTKVTNRCLGPRVAVHRVGGTERKKICVEWKKKLASLRSSR
jgi:hypothetical protein